MTSATLDELVLDTLYFRRTNETETCFLRNVAGEELRQRSADALPSVEQVLSNVVGPNFSESEDHPFHGLSDLLGAYMLIGSKYDVTRAVGFLRTLPPALQAKAVALVPVFFRKAKFRPQEKEVNDLKKPPGEQLLSLIKESSQSENQVLRENAVWAMSFFPL